MANTSCKESDDKYFGQKEKGAKATGGGEAHVSSGGVGDPCCYIGIISSEVTVPATFLALYSALTLLSLLQPLSSAVMGQKKP